MKLERSSLAPPVPTGFVCYDDFESYQDGFYVDGLIGGTGWTVARLRRAKLRISPTCNVAGQYVGLPGPFFAYDDFESYNDGDNVAGLNGGILNWNGVYVVV